MTKSCSTIIVDIDEVMADTNALLLPLFNLEFNKTFTIDDWTKFDICSLYGMTANDYYRIFDDALVATKAEPCEGAIEGISLMLSQGIEPTFLTARRVHGYDIPRTIAWLEKHGLPTNNVHIIGNDCKGLVTKQLTHKFNVLGFVDDGIHNIMQVKKHNPIIPAFCVDRPHNRVPGLIVDYHRIPSVLGAVNVILESRS